MLRPKWRERIESIIIIDRGTFDLDDETIEENRLESGTNHKSRFFSGGWKCERKKIEIKVGG